MVNKPVDKPVDNPPDNRFNNQQLSKQIADQLYAIEMLFGAAQILITEMKKSIERLQLKD